MPETQLPVDCAGAVVNVYISAVTLREALDLVERQLTKDRYRPVDFCEAYELDLEGTDFDTDEKGYPGNADLEQIRVEGGHWYGPFFTFPHEDEAAES